MEVKEGTDVKMNPCNSYLHRDCCKYTETLQEAVIQMTNIRQIQSDNKVFELQSKVFFNCPLYKGDIPDTILRVQNGGLVMEEKKTIVDFSCKTCKHATVCMHRSDMALLADSLETPAKEYINKGSFPGELVSMNIVCKLYDPGYVPLSQQTLPLQNAIINPICDQHRWQTK